MLQKIIIMGPPASGKDTQAELLNEEMGIPIISSGAVFRKKIKSNVNLGKRFAYYVKKGNLVPDDIVNKIIQKKIKTAKKFILTGYPRDLQQVQFLDKISSVDLVINIKVSDKEAIRRISGRRVCECGESFHLIFKKPKKRGVCDECGGKLFQRSDDKPAVVKNRLKLYHKATESIVKYYKKQNKLINVNGEQAIAKVHKEIVKQISKL